MPHYCHWPNCKVEVPPKLWGCKKHWFMLPAALRSRIWATYRPGQEITKDPSDEYIEAAKSVRKWILDNYFNGPVTEAECKEVVKRLFP